MDRRQAIAKATLTTASVTSGLLAPEQAKAFLVKIKEKTALSAAMRQVFKRASSGEIDKLSTASRIIRRATENADDGYRVGAAFDQIGYTTVKVRLPWEVTEDTFHENIEGEGLEATLTDQMTQQFALDLEDLEINGDTGAGAGPDQAFLQINDGILIQLADDDAGPDLAHHIDGSSIQSGVIAIEHFFAALNALPNRYRNALSGSLRWLMSPTKKIEWWEQLALRTGIAADALFTGSGGPAERPLGIPILEVPSFPDDVLILADPKNFVRVVSWDVRKRKVTGETDAQLAALDKRLYIWFLKHDVIIEELDAIVRVHTLDA